MLQKRIARNTLFKVLGEVFNRGGSLLLYVLLARFLGADDFGHYSFAFSYAALFIVVVDLGTNSIVTREIARQPASAIEIVPQVNTLKILSSVLALALIATTIPFLRVPAESKQLVMAMGLVIASTGFVEHFCAVLSGLERMGREAAYKLANKTLCVAGVLFGYVLTPGLWGAVGGLLAGFGVSVLIGYFFLWRTEAGRGLSWSWSWQKTFLIQSLPLLTSWLFWSLYKNQDILLLTFLKTPVEHVGWYAAAMKFVDVLRGLPVLVSGAFFPVLADFSKNDFQRFSAMSRFLIRWTLALSFPIAAGLALLAGPVLQLVYGIEFRPGAGALGVAAWAVIGVFLNHMAINLLIVLDRTSRTIYGAVFSALFNLAANLVLIPRFGLVGSAAALVLTEIGLCGFNFFFVQQKLSLIDKRFLGYIWKPAIATGSMWFLLTRFTIENVLVAVPLGAAVYFAVLFAVRGVPARLSFVSNLP